jgi:nucleoside-diphosphate-sugar epimerase
MNNKNVLVTGGAGFLGSHLCEYLINKKYQVICIDNLISGSEKNIAHLRSNPDFVFIRSDVTKDLSNVEKRIEKISAIFHLASPASPIDYWNFPEETLLVNSVGTINILRLGVKYNAKVLMASTSEIYGDPLVHPQKESYFGNVNSFGPRSCYDESKRFAEAAIYVFIEKYNLDARIIRIFNTYGPRMQKDDGRVVSNFINQALSNKDITIHGDGSQTRSFCYVSDLIRGIHAAMFSRKTKGQIFNLGNPHEFTIKQLAEKVIKMTGSKSKIKYSKSFRKDDPMRRKPDISKAKQYLRWEPKIDLEDGLQRTIEYYRSN